MRFLAVLILFLFSKNAIADISFARLVKLTSSEDSVSGKFVQGKYLKAFDTELLSSGEFSYQRSATLSWATLEPVENELLVTPESISNRQDGKELIKVNADGNPTIAVFYEILFSVLSSDWERLSGYFNLAGKEEGGVWMVKLVPLDNVIKNVIISVDMKGDEHVREVVLYETNGDRTTIDFRFSD